MIASASLVCVRRGPAGRGKLWRESAARRCRRVNDAISLAYSRPPVKGGHFSPPERGDRGRDVHSHTEATPCPS